MATQTPSAETWRDGSSTVAAAYVRPSRSRTAAPSGAPVRARVARARVTSFASSGTRQAAQSELRLIVGSVVLAAGSGRPG